MITDILKHLIKKISGLEQELRSLTSQNRSLLQKLEKERPLNIEQLEYKINELNIDKLSGILSLGLTAECNDVAVKKIIDKFGASCRVAVKPEGDERGR